jgi:hypothetical protein
MAWRRSWRMTLLRPPLGPPRWCPLWTQGLDARIVRMVRWWTSSLAWLHVCWFREGHRLLPAAVCSHVRPFPSRYQLSTQSFGCAVRQFSRYVLPASILVALCMLFSPLQWFMIAKWVHCNSRMNYPNSEIAHLHVQAGNGSMRNYSTV